MKRATLLLLVWLVPALAEADPLQLTIEPTTCSESRPTQVRLSVKPGYGQPQAILWLEAKIGAVKSKQGWERKKSGVHLAHLRPELITLDLIASEDLSNSAVARAPMPDVSATLEGAPHVLCRYAAQDEVLTRTITIVPLLDQASAELSWEAIALDPLAANGKIFVRKQGHSWTPGSDRQGLGHRPAPMGSRAGLRIELMRWAVWTGKKCHAVLIEEKAFKGMKRASASAKGQLKVEPAKFGLAAALAKAELEGDTTAVRLKDDRWILEQKGHWCVVGAEGPARLGEGKLFPFALDLARTGRAGFMWYAYTDHPELAKALEAGGFSTSRGKGMPIEVTEATLVPFLELLSKHGVQLSERGISKP